MSFTMHPAGPEDIDDITRIFQLAFADDHIMKYFSPNVPLSEQWEQDYKYFEGQIAEGHLYGGYYTKVVDEKTGDTVAFSKWQYPYTLTPEQKVVKEAKDKNHAPPRDGSNKELMKEFFEKLFSGRHRWINPEKTFFLHILAVLPEYQRRGLGGMLIRPGLEAADKAGAQTYVEASPFGLALYLRHGWEQVDEMVIDLRPYGGHGIEHQPYMMREPDAQSKLGK